MGFEQCISKALAATSFTDAMKATLQEAMANILLSQEKIKLQADKYHCKALQYAVEDKVWLGTNNLRLTCTLYKLTERWLGPYEVMELVDTNAIHLHLPCSMCIHDIINISHINHIKKIARSACGCPWSS